ncbi:MAG: hypothetical protein IKQ45_03365 [Clostridia bacterium]|nr:hypothetical protein [Clostridia bacterium]
MKKLIALVLMLCMLCTVALADNEITWDQVYPTLEAAGITGDFVTFDEIAVKVFIPAGAEAVELSDEDKANGYIGYFTDESGDAIAVQYVNVDGMDLETYAAQVAEAGGTEIETGTVNGLPCISYEYNDNMICAFTTQMGYILEVAVGPLPDENAKLAAGFILASIQAAE